MSAFRRIGSSVRRPAAVVAVSALGLAAVALLAPVRPASASTTASASTATATATATATSRSPLDQLRAGPVPGTVPYAIGTVVRYRGYTTDVSARFDRAFPGSRLAEAQRRLTTVVGGGGYAWVQLTGAATDLAHVVGRIGPRGGWTGFHVSSGAMSLVAVTTTGLVIMPESGQAYRTDGRLAATFTGSTSVGCGFCGPAAAGPHVVVDRKPSGPGQPHQGTWLWTPAATAGGTPAAAPVRLPDGYRALGRLGSGWLGSPEGRTCWRVAPTSDPAATRAAICSQTLPLVSADGARAVVVQAGRMRVVDTRTAAGVSLARIRLATWTPAGPGAVRYVVPAAWESADSYLAVARDDRVLAVVRCSVTTGRCERAVRATVRTGVDRIVLERGPADIVTMR